MKQKELFTVEYEKEKLGKKRTKFFSKKHCERFAKKLETVGYDVVFLSVEKCYS